jgi:hypothetical protein
MTAAIRPNAGAGGAKPGGRDEAVTQAIQDFILAQIARHWVLDFRSPRLRNMVLNGNMILLPNGMLGPPFGKNDPWRPAAMIRDYDKLGESPNGLMIRTALVSFVQAARQAQPFRLPADTDIEHPVVVPFDFRLGDMPAPGG